MMDQRIDLPLPFGQGAGTAKEFLESFVKSVANALALIIEQIGGIPPQVRWRILYQEFLFYGIISLSFLALAFAIHAVIFFILQRRIERRRKKNGSDDLWVLFLSAVRGPLKLAFWVYAILCRGSAVIAARAAGSLGPSGPPAL